LHARPIIVSELVVPLRMLVLFVPIIVAIVTPLLGYEALSKRPVTVHGR
jgi:hypothetical protein